MYTFCGPDILPCIQWYLCLMKISRLPIITPRRKVSECTRLAASAPGCENIQVPGAETGIANHPATLRDDDVVKVTGHLGAALLTVGPVSYTERLLHARLLCPIVDRMPRAAVAFSRRRRRRCFHVHRTVSLLRNATLNRELRRCIRRGCRATRSRGRAREGRVGWE